MNDSRIELRNVVDMVKRAQSKEPGLTYKPRSLRQCIRLSKFVKAIAADISIMPKSLQVSS